MGKQIKIQIYDKKATVSDVINLNGIALDNICTKAETTENITTGNYVGDFTFLIDDTKLYDKIQEECILKVKMDYGDEVFRVTKIQGGTRYLNVVARQITIDECLALHLEDVRPTSTGGQGALSAMLEGAEGTKQITLSSDIATIGTSYYEDKSMYEAIWGSDNSFISVWGGETLRRGYNISINNHVGIDRNVVIAEGRNLTGFECNTNVDDLITRARGKGYDGIKGNWVNSPLIDTYAKVRTKTYEYKVRVRESGQTDEEGYTYFDTLAEAQVELDRLASLEFSNNNVDKIKASYNVNFVQLEQTEEYKNYIAAERCYIGDTLRVYIPRLEVDISVRVVEKKFDILSGKVKELVLSNYAEPKALSIADIGKAIVNATYTQQTLFEQAKKFSSDLLKSGLKNSYVVVRTDEILIMDTKDINTATKVWRFNNAGLGFSSTGYNGTYGTAITSDGKIVADMITTGILSAITIKNLDGSFQIDLSGSGGCNFYNSNKIAMRIANNNIKFYNWVTNGDYLGQIGCTTYGPTNKQVINISSDVDSAVTFSSKRTGDIDYIGLIIDYYKNLGFSHPISILLDANLTGHGLYMVDGGTARIYGNDSQVKTDGTLVVHGDLLVTGKIIYQDICSQGTVTG